MSSSISAAQGSDGILTFYRDLDEKGRRTFWACFGGYAMDAMDFMVFPLVIGTLISLWKMDAATAGGIATVTLLCSAVGGWGAGFLADRIGRIRTMQITILTFSVGSLLSAFAQDATQLTIFRAILGLGFGGEAAVAAVTLSEVVAPRQRGRAIGFYQSSYAVGWAAAVLVQAAAFAWLPAETAWRAMFAVGFLPALLIFFIRRNVAEPSVAASSRTGTSQPGLGEILTGDNLKPLVLGSLLTLGAQGGFYALMTWMPQFLRTERHISVLGSAPYLMALIFGCFLGYIAGGWLSDRFGRRPVFIVFALAAGTAVYLYTHVALSDAQVLMLGFPLGFFAVGYYGPLMTCLSELFPTRNRGAGVGFTYNAGRAIGGLFPFLVGVVSAHMSLGDAISLFAISSYALVLVMALVMRETKGLAFSATTAA